jgi:Divergent InlB B-repeat domain
VRGRLVLVIAFVTAVLVLLGGAAASQAAPGSLRILFAANELGSLDPGIVPAIAAEPGVATVDTFDTSTGTPSPATLATYDLVVSVGASSYNDPVAWGNELADYLDAGGAVIQFAYDNWESSGAHPTGRFESGGYAPFVPGPNDNLSTTLGTILAPDNPLLAGVATLNTSDNTTDALASGATLLAKWADGRNAIATKGRVESVTASLDNGNVSPVSTIAQLVVNAGNVLGRHALTVTKTGSGTGSVTSSPAGINCGSTCTFNYAYGTSVTLTATPASGSTASLSGPGCSGGATCTVTVNSATAITATFTLLPDALTVTKTGSGTGTVTSSPAGISCGSTCTFNYAYGTSVTLTATPASGSTASLSGPGCSGGATCTVTVNSATAITATFTLLRPSHTRIIKAKINKKKHTASFTFTASGKVTGFQCALLPLKKKGHKRPKLRFRACTSPRIYKHLKPGRYKFEVRAVNSIGPDRKPAIKRFTMPVRRQAAALPSQPGNIHNAGSVTDPQTQIRVAWNPSTDAVDQIDHYNVLRNGSLVDVRPGNLTAPDHVSSGLTCGTSYTFSVTAIDTAGLVSPAATLTTSTAACTTTSSSSSSTTTTSSTTTSSTSSSLPLLLHREAVAQTGAVARNRQRQFLPTSWDRLRRTKRALPE